MMKASILRAATALAAAATLAACSSTSPNAPNPRTVATAPLNAAVGVPQPNPQSPVQGAISFSELRGIVSVSGTVTGLKPNAAHAFHVHENGDCSAPDFSSAGSHFNPTGTPHGQHGSGLHHLGDMPPLMADASGTAQVSFNSQTLTLRGPNSIIGKSIIVHRDPDDFNAQPVGNAGPRLACGIIRLNPGA